jgi:hypothetical protein
MTVDVHCEADVKIHILRSMTSTINISRGKRFSNIGTARSAMANGGTGMVGGSSLSDEHQRHPFNTLTDSDGTFTVNNYTLGNSGNTLTIHSCTSPSTMTLSSAHVRIRRENPWSSCPGSTRSSTHLNSILIYIFLCFGHANRSNLLALSSLMIFSRIQAGDHGPYFESIKQYGTRLNRLGNWHSCQPEQQGGRTLTRSDMIIRWITRKRKSANLLSYITYYTYL